MRDRIEREERESKVLKFQIETAAIEENLSERSELSFRCFYFFDFFRSFYFSLFFFSSVFLTVKSLTVRLNLSFYEFYHATGWFISSPSLHIFIKIKLDRYIFDSILLSMHSVLAPVSMAFLKSNSSYIGWNSIKSFMYRWIHDSHRYFTSSGWCKWFHHEYICCDSIAHDITLEISKYWLSFTSLTSKWD